MIFSGDPAVTPRVVVVIVPTPTFAPSFDALIGDAESFWGSHLPLPSLWPKSDGRAVTASAFSLWPFFRDAPH